GVRRTRSRIGRTLKRAHAAELASVGGTTHVSVIDADGNAASLSTSTGSGSGVIVPGTGIYMNNMLGEYDLVAGRTIPPGRRLASTQPLLRRRGGSGDLPGRNGRRGGRPAPRRRRRRRRVSLRIRAAEPGDAAELVALASAVGAEPEGWLLADARWRSVPDEPR